MFDPNKSSFDALAEIAVTSLVFTALLFLAGLKAERGEAPRTSPLKSVILSLGR